MQYRRWPMTHFVYRAWQVVHIPYFCILVHRNINVICKITWSYNLKQRSSYKIMIFPCLTMFSVGENLDVLRPILACWSAWEALGKVGLAATFGSRNFDKSWIWDVWVAWSLFSGWKWLGPKVFPIITKFCLATTFCSQLSNPDLMPLEFNNLKVLLPFCLGMRSQAIYQWCGNLFGRQDARGWKNLGVAKIWAISMSVFFPDRSEDKLKRRKRRCCIHCSFICVVFWRSFPGSHQASCTACGARMKKSAMRVLYGLQRTPQTARNFKSFNRILIGLCGRTRASL